MARGRGLYGVFPGIQAGDFVVFVDHRGRYRVDYVTTDKGNHLTIGPTRGYGTLAEAKRAAAEESFRRGHSYGLLFELRGDEPIQIGHIVEGRFSKDGSGRDTRPLRRKTPRTKAAARHLQSMSRDPRRASLRRSVLTGGEYEREILLEAQQILKKHLASGYYPNGSPMYYSKEIRDAVPWLEYVAARVVVPPLGSYANPRMAAFAKTGFRTPIR